MSFSTSEFPLFIDDPGSMLVVGHLDETSLKAVKEISMASGLPDDKFPKHTYERPYVRIANLGTTHNLRSFCETNSDGSALHNSDAAVGDLICDFPDEEVDEELGVFDIQIVDSSERLSLRPNEMIRRYRNLAAEMLATMIIEARQAPSVFARSADRTADLERRKRVWTDKNRPFIDIPIKPNKSRAATLSRNNLRTKRLEAIGVRALRIERVSLIEGVGKAPSSRKLTH